MRWEVVPSQGPEVGAIYSAVTNNSWNNFTLKWNAVLLFVTLESTGNDPTFFLCSRYSRSCLMFQVRSVNDEAIRKENSEVKAMPFYYFNLSWLILYGLVCLMMKFSKHLNSKLNLDVLKGLLERVACVQLIEQRYEFITPSHNTIIVNSVLGSSDQTSSFVLCWLSIVILKVKYISKEYTPMSVLTIF